eukprot:CAMPEP_0172722800 /NCGR_PEP_ID=MMETSP1074-20121228/82341_1 /TAXON_ID=2916 /ORGANISM="Ceratium fusus, Strain PA161109" /LENGTH=240 /DNA_ID=CAMNT_0013548883 /DNA_START=60 /DNA_END=782 /DNA_ORIENTATION=+
MSSICDPARFCPCSLVAIVERRGVVQRALAANGQPFPENIFFGADTNTICFLQLLNGSETDVERVVVLQTHPLQIELHLRTKADGSKTAALSSVDAFLREVQHMEGATPTTICHGITSAFIRDGTFHNLFAAPELAIQEVRRGIDVDHSSCLVKGCVGFLTRTQTMSASGELVTERRPTDDERLLADRMPTRHYQPATPHQPSPSALPATPPLATTTPLRTPVTPPRNTGRLAKGRKYDA